MIFNRLFSKKISSDSLALIANHNALDLSGTAHALNGIPGLLVSPVARAFALHCLRFARLTQPGSGQEYANGGLPARQEALSKRRLAVGRLRLLCNTTRNVGTGNSLLQILSLDPATLQPLHQHLDNQGKHDETRENTQRSGRIFQRVEKPDHDRKQAGQDT